jgi:hypothetical protein
LFLDFLCNFITSKGLERISKFLSLMWKETYSNSRMCRDRKQGHLSKLYGIIM